MRNKQTFTSGFIMGELIVALTILGGLMVTIALSLDGIKRFNHYQWTRLCCIDAAQAQLDCIEASTKPIETDLYQSLWPRIVTEIDQQPGQDPWEGLTLVTIHAEAQSYHRTVKVTLARYMLLGKQHGGGHE